MELLRFITSKVGVSGIIGLFLGFFGVLLLSIFCFGTLEALCADYTFSFASCLVGVVLVGFPVCIGGLYICNVVEFLNRLKY